MKRYKEINDAIGFTLGKRFEDGLTNLPSCLRTKILSCLPTKDAVRTSILSTQWKWSWTFVTNLDFDDRVVKASHSNADFISFVYRVLLLRDKSCLQRFRMKCQKYNSGSLINTWISAVLLYCVKELDLSFRCRNPYLFPCELFLCKTFVVLKLDTSCHVNLPASVSLPNLKTLHISKLRISDDMSFANLLSGCPVLEELRLSVCEGKDVRVINISSPALTSLTLEYLIYWTTDGDYNRQVVINTPSLKYLKLIDYDVQGYVFKNLNNLIKAEINSRTLVDKAEEITGLFTDFFIGISQVQSLVLSRQLDINWCQIGLPTFSNLTYLEIDYAPKRLLENSPCLETLHLRKGCWFIIDRIGLRQYQHCPRIDGVPPSCFLSHLKVIRIDGFGGNQGEMKMVEYFLKNAKVLEKLILHYQRCAYNNEEKTNFLKKLVMLPKASIVCKVEVL